MTAELANLRRARFRCRFRLKQAADLAQACCDNLAELEAVSAYQRPNWILYDIPQIVAGMDRHSHSRRR